MNILITGGTGFLGSYVVDSLLSGTDHRLSLMVRAKSRDEAAAKLWRAMQLHGSETRFRAELKRIDFVSGDLVAPGLGLSAEARRDVVRSVDSVLHIAASLNRKSEKECLNTNLRGTLSMVKLAREIKDARGLARFSHVSTVAVAGKRDREVVREDDAIDWKRSDYDPYARTKKFCEHMIRELLPDVPKTFFRPSIVMGDSRKPETTQFDMVQAFCLLADLPFVPVRSDGRLDIVNADFVGKAIARLHAKERTDHEIYHLSAGTASSTAGRIVEALVRGTGRRPTRFLPRLERPFSWTVDALAALPGRGPVQGIATLLKVFLPYITYDTVFDNARVTGELGIRPTPFTEYCAPLYEYAKRVKFEYPYAPLSDTPRRAPTTPRRKKTPPKSARKLAPRAPVGIAARTPPPARRAPATPTPVGRRAPATKSARRAA